MAYRKYVEVECDECGAVAHYPQQHRDDIKALLRKDTWIITHGDKEYFCSASCRENFRQRRKKGKQ